MTAVAIEEKLPLELSTGDPPEADGRSRASVRLLVAQPSGITHTVFADIGAFLHRGDLLVVNTSATIAAAIDGRRGDGRQTVVHFATPLDDGTWVVELRHTDASAPQRDGRAGERVLLPDDASLELIEQYGIATAPDGPRLWRARLRGVAEVHALLGVHGRPIRYAHTRRSWPLAMYQTVFAREPGSAEMPSAGRPFTEALVVDLMTHGVVVAPVLLHAGVSSPGADEGPLPERFRVPRETAMLVNATRGAGGRVIAVGTTVTRALETCVDGDGSAVAGAGWTDIVLSRERPARLVDGLVTGWHEPGTSHLLLLEAVAGAPLVHEAYQAALANHYRWHEFGDSCLLLRR